MGTFTAMLPDNKFPWYLNGSSWAGTDQNHKLQYILIQSSSRSEPWVGAAIDRPGKTANGSVKLIESQYTFLRQKP